MIETEKKKHKSGYDLLKEKVAKLEKERDNYKAMYEETLKERMELGEKLMYERNAHINIAHASSSLDKEKNMLIAFLLDHCPFLVRWMYNIEFKEGKEKL